MRLLVNHMQGKIYLNIIRYKRELRFERKLRFECELQVYISHACNCMLMKIDYILLINR